MRDSSFVDQELKSRLQVLGIYSFLPYLCESVHVDSNYMCACVFEIPSEVSISVILTI